MAQQQLFIRGGVLAELEEYLTVRGAQYGVLAHDAGLGSATWNLGATGNFPARTHHRGIPSFLEAPRRRPQGQRPDRTLLEREKKSRRTRMSSTQLVAAMNKRGWKNQHSAAMA